MPTPFMHLHMAEKLISHAALDQALCARLRAHWPAFYFGSIVPDFQAIADIRRDATHFYPIPPEKDDYAAFERLLTAYPQCRYDAEMPADRAIFLAAYSAHLTFDLLWDHTILTPIFRYGEWEDKFGRYNAHNTLLTALDRVALAALPDGGHHTLSACDPAGWLPFGSDADVSAWQSMVANQLLPGAKIHTVELYAKRMRLTPEIFAGQLDDPAWMADHIYRYVSQEEVQATLDRAVELGIEVIGGYLKKG